MRGRLVREATAVQTLRSRPVMADPGRLLSSFADEIATARERATRAARSRFTHAAEDVDHLRHRVRALSPAATLARGYAVAQTADGRVVRSPANVVTLLDLKEGTVVVDSGCGYAWTAATSPPR